MMVTAVAAPVSSSSLSSSKLKIEDVIKPSSWKGLTFADFDKSPSKRKKDGSSSPAGWMLLATAQQIDLGSPKKKKKKESKKSTAKTKTTDGKVKTKTTRTKVHIPSSTKSLTKLSEKAVGGNHFDDDIALSVGKPISTSELTATTVTMTSERDEEEFPLVPVVTKLSVIEEPILGAMLESEEDDAMEIEPTASPATPKKSKKKKAKSRTPSPEKKKKSSSTKKVEKHGSTSPIKKKKKSKKIKSNDTTTPVDDTDVAKYEAIVEGRLQEIEKLELLLKDERQGLLSKKASVSCDKEIMRYIIQQEAERTDEMAQKIEGLQERVVRMQQQELAMLQQDSKDRSKIQEHVLELQDLVQKQANEIQRFKKEIREMKQAGMVDDEKDLFDDMQTLVEENKDLFEEKKSLEEQLEYERIEWQKLLDSKDETIAELQKEVKSLKKSLFQATSSASVAEEGNGEKPSRNNDIGGWNAFQDELPSTPEAPKPAKKEKVSLEGMNKDAFKPPLEDII